MDIAHLMGFPTTAAISNLRAIPKGVWMLGFASMFMDISSEMIHALLPIYLVSILGATTRLRAGLWHDILPLVSYRERWGQ
jgi:hypothetical protein